MSQEPADRTGAPRLRPAADRGRFAGDAGIEATEAFSRGDAIDRAWMGWGPLRVLSRQEWAPGATRDDGRLANMERLLLVLDGVLDVECAGLGRHRVAAGDMAWIGSGHGTEVRMANASDTAPLRLLECWLQPDRVNARPAVAVRPGGVDGDAESGGRSADAWATLASSAADAPAGALPLRQRAHVMAARIGAGARVVLPAAGAARCWLEILEGDVLVPGAERRNDTRAGAAFAGQRLAAGDGLGWLAGDAGAPTSIEVAQGGPAWLLFLALPA